MIFVDGVDIGDPDDVALRDRRTLSADGLFIVVATVSGEHGEPVADPEVIIRGVPFLDEDEVADADRGSAGRRRRVPGTRRRRRSRAGADPAGPPRRCRRLRLRPAQAPPDGAPGDRRGLSRRQKLGPPDQGGGPTGRIGSGWANLMPAAAVCFRVGSLRVLSRPAHMVDGADKPRLKRAEVFAQSSRQRSSNTANLAPPLPERPALTSPPWAIATARTIDRPRPVPSPLDECRSAGPAPRTKRSKTCSLHAVRQAGPVVRDLDQRVAVPTR